MEFNYAISLLDGDYKQEEGIVRKFARKTSKAPISELEKHWERQIRPAMEDIFEDDTEYIFKPETIAEETDFTEYYVEECLDHYEDNLDEEDFRLEKKPNGFWHLQRY